MLDNIICLNFKESTLMINLDTLKKMHVSKTSLPLIKRIINKKHIKETEKPFVLEFEDFLKSEGIYKVGKMDSLISPTLILTYDCNYSCVYCFEKNEKGIKNQFTVDHVKKVDEFYDKYCSYYGIPKAYDTITITGGETLLPQNRSVLEKIFSCWESNKFYIFTNGTYS